MTFWHYIGAVIVLGMIVAVGIYSGRKYGNQAPSHSASSGLVTGALLGTLIGGSSTIGTSQLAYHYGFSAWWYTLGAGIGLIIMALFFVKPIYESNIQTYSQLFVSTYGTKSGLVAAVLNSIGTLLSLVAQILAGVALITAIAPFSTGLTTLFVVALMSFYVYAGGSLGAGYIGRIKTILIIGSVVICGSIALYLHGGMNAYLQSLPVDTTFNLFARGYVKDIGAGLSVVVGILTTQSYMNAFIMADSVQHAKRGVFIGGILTMLIGVFGIFVGLYMRIYAPGIDAKLALPLFILEHTPALLGGAMIGTLLITIVGSGAGLSGGVSAIFIRDIYKPYLHPEADESAINRLSHLFPILILFLCSTMTLGNLGDMILGWSFMSMGLRGSVSFVPLIVALFFKGRMKEQYAVLSMIAGAGFTLIGKFILPSNIDSLFLGLLAAIIIAIIGYTKYDSK